MVDGRTDLLRDVADKDHEPLRECLRWLDYANPFFRKFWSLTQGVFKQVRGKTASVIQLASLRTRISSKRRPPTPYDSETQLSQTIAGQQRCLAVIDPEEYPTT